MTASPVDVAVNPNNLAQRYVLWGNGRIDSYGGAVPITGQDTWYDSMIPMPVAVAIHITNWATGAGYVFDLYGGFHPLNGAPTISQPTGVPYVLARNYVDWAWKPDGSGQGYALSAYGQLHEFGGATPAPRQGGRWTQPFAKKLQVNWGADLRALTLDAYGGLSPDFNGVAGAVSVYWPHQDNARDFVVTDWATGSGYVLDLFGAQHEFGSAPGAWGFPYLPGADVARNLVVLSATNPMKFWQVWSGGQQYEYVSSTPPTVNAGAAVNEAQTLVINGSPTGGTFTLTYSGQTTTAIAYNATSAAIQSALIALSNIGTGDVTVTGAVGSPRIVTFTGVLAATNVAQLTATSSLTGGTSPTVAIATITEGGSSPAKTTTTTTRPTLAWTYSDPQKDAQKAWQLLVFTQAFVDGHSMTDPFVWRSSALAVLAGSDPNTRGVVADYDFPNGSYRFYVAVQDAAGQWSAWSNFGWTQNVTPPATPTGLTATANQATFSAALSVSATTGGSANRIRFECSDDAGVTWLPVRGADAVTLAATTTATDWDAPLGVARQYRAKAYAIDPRVISAASSAATATLTRRTYVLTAVNDSTLGGEVRAQEPIEWTRPVAAGVFEGIGAEFPTVVSDGTPKARRTRLGLLSLDKATWTRIEALAESDSTLVYRDPYGVVMYCRLVGDWTRSLLVLTPAPGEVTAVRHSHTTDLPLVEVAPPHLPDAANLTGL